MLKYRGPKLLRSGLIGVVVILLISLVGLTPEYLINMATSVKYRAEFTDTGGLSIGNDVSRSGVIVGSVTGIELSHGKAVVTFTVDARTPLGSETTVHVRTGSLLGQRVLTLEPRGEEKLSSGDLIPVSQTSAPYSLSDAVGDLTENTAGTDTQSLNESLDTLASTIDAISPQVAATFDGVAALSRELNSRRDSLADLLKSAGDVAEILAKRSGAVNSLILNANDLVAQLNSRREDIASLLANVAAVSRQLSGLVADNEAELAPTLERLNSVTEVLQRNRDNIAKALPGLAKYQLTQGESVSSGYYYQAFEPNILPLQTLQPFLDYAFGFRRGVNQGQPPDNAGPRAELPFPYNGIPLQGGGHP
ncbi:MCE family protein [Mycobacterium sp. 236(2023)]|uniref:MCE family protein n=1 Tax=Mycobacterium sp. 236(2023) TaxID=3038163 RepID=UPI0024151B00|nr:MCE family protein [Mycobacterium sp. 236(2023)]MDG4667922.1 MCE family protein [Mycobacterium sp. 236(2023)]